MPRKIPGRALSPTTVITVANTQANVIVANVVAVGISVNIGDSLAANSSTIRLGNSTVNTVIHTTGVTGNGAGLHTVNAAALQGNSVSDILVSANTAANTLASAAYSNAIAYSGNAALAYSNATSYADTKAATAFTNAASRADSAYSNAIAYSGNAALAYSNAIAYAASNTRVNEQLDLRAALAGATFTGAVTVSNTLSVGNNVTITGNLTVTGTRIFANTTTVDLGDNIITLNADIGAAAPSENAGFEIHRGTSANVSLLWNETNDKWTLTTDGTTYLNIATNNDVTTAYSNAIAYSGNAALAYSNAVSYADTKAATAFSNAASRADSAYSNAIAYSANGSNISSGTVAFARLPALYLGTTQIQSSSAAQAVSGITTLAAGNTTITGFANVTSTLQVAGVSTLTGNVNTSGLLRIAGGGSDEGSQLGLWSDINGSCFVAGFNLQFNTGGNNSRTATLTLNSNKSVGFAGPVGGITTLAAGNTTITGFANVTSTIQGGSSLTIAGALSGVTTAAMGNTTITGFANVTSTLQVGGVATFAANANFDSGVLFVDGTNNRVGINTTGPQSRMQIFGSTAPETGDAASTETMLTLTREGSATVWREGASFALGRWQTGGGSNPFSRLDINLKSVTDNSSLPNVTVMTLQDNGNVGIGTTTPGSKLHVYGATGQILRIESSAADGGGFGWIGFYDAAGRKAYVGSGGNDNNFYLNIDGSGGSFYFNAGAATRQVIAANGNVGIGTTAPTAKLQIEAGGNNLALSRSGFAVQQLGVGTVSGINGLHLTDVTNSKTIISIAENAPAGSLALIASGNVGINTTSPATKLNVLVGAGGANGTAGIRIGGVSNYESLELGILDNYGAMFRSYGNDMHYYSGHWRTVGTGASEDHAHYWYTSKTGSANWSTAKLILDADGALKPGADNTYNLGTSSLRWANIYTADLNMSNKGSQNDIDGTWGDWTIQEGEEDLFLLNRRNGKKYKFLLKEIE